MPKSVTVKDFVVVVDNGVVVLEVMVVVLGTTVLKATAGSSNMEPLTKLPPIALDG